MQIVTIGCKGMCFENDATISIDREDVFSGKEYNWYTDRSKQSSSDRTKEANSWNNSMDAHQEVRELYNDNKGKLAADQQGKAELVIEQ